MYSVRICSLVWAHVEIASAVYCSSILLLVYRVCCSGFLVGCEWDPRAPAYGFAFGGYLLAGSEFGRWSFRRLGRRFRALG